MDERIVRIYQILYCPENSFGDNSCYRHSDFMDMLRSGFLYEGTKVECRGKVGVVVKIRGDYKLKRIGR